MAKKRFQCFGTIVDNRFSKWTNADVCPEDFSDFLKNVEPADELEIALNSPGGSCIAGFAIVGMLKKKPCCKVIAHVYGIAASMASVIACACDEIEMDASAFMMIHNPSGWSDGDAAAFRKEADLLDKMKDSIVDVYAGKFSVDKKKICSMMDDVTWFSGLEADKYGLKATVIPNAAPASAGGVMKMAACLSRVPLDKIPAAACHWAKLVTVTDMHAAAAPVAAPAAAAPAPTPSAAAPVTAAPAPTTSSAAPMPTPSAAAPVAAPAAAAPVRSSASDSAVNPASDSATPAAAPSNAAEVKSVTDLAAALEKVTAKARDFQSARDKALAEVKALKEEAAKSAAAAKAEIEKLAAEKNDFQKRLASMALNAFGGPEKSVAMDFEELARECGSAIEAAKKNPALADWQSLADAFGYAEAKRRWPEKYDAFMASHVSKNDD